MKIGLPDTEKSLVVSRFAPSPTGSPHAGNIFAYLVTWLLTKSLGGSIVFRIEDLDSSRSRPEYADSLLRMLDETGLTFDRGPFFQSDRVDAYHSIFKELSDRGLTYPCFCTRRDLSFQNAPHASDGIRVYDRRCKYLSHDEVFSRTLELERQGRRPASRLTTDSREICFHDLIQGDQRCILDEQCGDFIIRRSDEDFAYHLAVVADDIEQGVSLVCRGCDLLGCTPQQIYLYQLLGKDEPIYAHFPLLCAQDGKRLAKRDRSATYDELKESLGSPEHVIGHIAFISGLRGEDGPVSLQELLDEVKEKFSTGKLDECFSDKTKISFDI